MLHSLLALSVLAGTVSFETTGVISVPIYEHILGRELGRDWRELPSERIELVLETFLQQTGYSLSSVEIERKGNHRVVTIDEHLNGIIEMVNVIIDLVKGDVDTFVPGCPNFKISPPFVMT